MKMSWVIGVSLLCCFSACSKGQSKSTADLYKDAPRSEVPDQLAPGMWRLGSVSALGYYNDWGNHVGNSQESLREFKVTRDGYAEFVQYLSVSSGACYNQTYTHLKGTLFFEAPNKMTWTPVEGDFAQNFPCTSGKSTRAATKADLERSKAIYWYKVQDVYNDGTLYLFVYTDPSLTDQYREFTYRIIK
jgi:hypothetical protein